MGRPKHPRGVEVRENSIRISFQWQGKRCRETMLGLDPLKPAHVQKAAQTLKRINAEIVAGTFDYAEYFPQSAEVATAQTLRPESAARTFASVGREWLDGHDVERGTRQKYEQDLVFWSSHLDGRRLQEWDYQALRKVIAGIDFPSGKTYNNRLIALRSIFRYAQDIDLIEENPASRIPNRKHQKAGAHPLAVDEVNRLLAFMGERYPAPITNYFKLAIFAGLRPEELIAWKWEDIDFDHPGGGVISVRRARSASADKSTKTHRARLVRLNTMSRQALLNQQSVSREGTVDQEYVFFNPGTGRRWNSEKFQRQLWWTPALKACGIAHRAAYQTRHTYASLALSAGATPYWVAEQLGHTTPQMVFEHYGKWIDAFANSGEHRKIERMFEVPDQQRDARNIEFVPGVSPEKEG